MSTHIYTAPAAAGKTEYLLKRAQREASGLGAEVRVCAATLLQAQAWRRRLAEAGGAIGVRVLTFDQLYRVCLDEAGETYALLSEPVQYRLLRNIVAQIPLTHYKPLVERPGFIQVLQSFIEEVKGARIMPGDFRDAVVAMGDEPRLAELGLIYERYQEQLHERGWADRAGLGWLAVEALEQRAQDVASDWPLLLVDGFDNFTAIQMDLLKVLSGRVGEMIITLTGPASRHGEGNPPRPVYRRYLNTMDKLEKKLAVRAERLLEQRPAREDPLGYLERNLFFERAGRAGAGSAIQMVEVPDRAAEVRTALRWLKQRIVKDGLNPDEAGLLVRNLTPYRPVIVETAAEFGLPVRIVGGLPLGSSPVIAALLDLLRLALPANDDDPGPALPRGAVIRAWRSPYFGWLHANDGDGEDGEVIGIEAADADVLDTAARWGRVIGGLQQWEELLSLLAGRSETAPPDEDLKIPSNLPSGDEALELQRKFSAFARRVQPPFVHTYRDYIGWLEALIGEDPDPQDEEPVPDPASLNVVLRAREGDARTAELDVAALRKLKEILRGLVWAEAEAGDGRLIDYPLFLAELAGAIESTTFQPAFRGVQSAVSVTDMRQGRGVPFQAVALLGLAEGEFPASLFEDPFLRESDRQALREKHGFDLESSIESSEREFFYEAVTRPARWLLVTRPRLADTGAEWPASPFWEEMLRLLDLQPITKTSEDVPPPREVVSPAELMESLSSRAPDHRQIEMIEPAFEERLRELEAAGRLFRTRFTRYKSPHDGDLTGQPARFGSFFHPDYRWSPSSLESYRACPLMFFVGKVLGLQPRLEPVEGTDAAQTGTIYHEILQGVYSAVAPEYRGDVDKLLEVLPAVAAKILDEAPRRQGFRETAWWQQTRAEIQDNVERSLRALAELPGDYVPIRFEAAFFGPYELRVFDGEDRFKLGGFIDRVDRDAAGRLRIIDYKTAGPYNFGANTLEQGKKLQLPLYALAARDGLKLGEPAEGFYWHVIQAEASGLKLSEYGPEEAISTAVGFAWEVVRGARGGHFVPEAPSDGCPGYCPAAAFCWQYRPNRWG